MFNGLGERRDSEARLVLGCLPEKRLEILRGRLWVRSFCVMGYCGEFGLEMWILLFFVWVGWFCSGRE